MAGARKRTKKPTTQSSGDESETDSYQGQQEIQADFEGRNPESEDFHGIKQLLRQLFLKSHIDLSQITDMLINQPGLGSVLKQSFGDDSDDEDDDVTSESDVFGITSVLNLTLHKDKACVQQLINLIKELSNKSADKNNATSIQNILDGNKKLGLLINERFVNIPAKISDPLLTSLLTEFDRIKKKEPTYDFDYFVLICKLHKPKGGTDVIFANAEEEIFAKESEVSFEFDVTSESDTSSIGKWSEGDTEMLPHRRVLFLRGHKIQSVVQQIKQFVA